MLLILKQYLQTIHTSFEMAVNINIKALAFIWFVTLTTGVKLNLAKVSQPKIGFICTTNTCRDFTQLIEQEISEKMRNETNSSEYYELQKENYLEVFSLDANTLSPGHILQTICQHFLPNGVNTIIYANTNTQDIYNKKSILGYRYLMSVSNSLGIPIIAWNPAVDNNLKNNEMSNVLELTPSIIDQSTVMLDILYRYGWQRFSIITTAAGGNSDFAGHLNKMAEMGQFKLELQNLINIVQVERKNVRNQLKTFSRETKVILLHSSLKEAQIIFDAAKNLSMTAGNHQWIVSKSVLGGSEKNENYKYKDLYFPSRTIAVTFSTDENAIKKAVGKGAAIWLTALEHFTNTNDKLGITSTSILPNISCHELEPDNMYWKDSTKLFQFMKNVSILDEKHKTRIGDSEALKEMLMTIVDYNHERKVWHEIGEWNNIDRLTLDRVAWPFGGDKMPKSNRQKWKLDIVTLDEEPYVIVNEIDNETGKCSPGSLKAKWATLNLTDKSSNVTENSTLYKCLNGLAIDLLIKLETDIGFEYNIFKVEDGKWGDNETGEWNGLLRTIMDRKADMCVTSLKINNDRSDVIDFSHPYMETGITIIVGIRQGGISAMAFLEPYDFTAWCFVLLVVVHVFGAVIFLFEWLSPKGMNKGATTSSREHPFSLCRSFWMMWAMLLGSSVSIDSPRGIASRFAANVWALFAIVFLASYTANLAAVMIANDEYYKLRGIQDPLLTNPQSIKPAFTYGTVKSGNTANVLRNNYPEQYRYMETFNTDNKIQGIRKVKEGSIDAFIYDATVLEFLASKDKDCNLRTVGNWYARTGYGLGFPRGDKKWQPIINQFILKYQEEGWLEKQQSFWMSGPCTESGSGRNDESSHPLSTMHFISAYYLLAGGILISLLLVMLEHCYVKCLRRKCSKLDKYGCMGMISLTMGGILNVEQSARAILAASKHFKCKNSVCETQKWKIRHELDMSLIRIKRLENKMREFGFKVRTIQSGERETGSPESKRDLKEVTATAGQPGISINCSIFKEPRGKSVDISQGDITSAENKISPRMGADSIIRTQPIRLESAEMESKKSRKKLVKFSEHDVICYSEMHELPQNDDAERELGRRNNKKARTYKINKRRKILDGNVYDSVPTFPTAHAQEKLEAMETVV